MAELPDGWGLVGLSDETGRELPVHWLADRRMLPLLGGEFFSTAYNHCFCDQELMDIAKEHNRYVMCEKAIVRHDHPFFTEGPFDEHYQRVYQRDSWQHDRVLYYQRIRERKQGGIAIGFPLINEFVPWSFFYSCLLSVMTFLTTKGNKPNQYHILVPTYPHGQFPKSIDDARNSLVEQAQNAGCSWLFMLDTDQVYPQNMFTALYAYKKDICGALVHRGWPPYEPILKRGELNHYENVTDDEAFSGDLINVDATGTGCLLINMAVFDELLQPYFKTTIVDGNPVGEDIRFCSKARELGREIFVDTSVKVGHLRQICVDRLYYEINKKLNNGGLNNGKESR